MKPIKKKFAKLYIAILAIVLVVASLFVFVPMPWGNFNTYNSFIGDLKFAGDIEGGYYAEYKIVSGNSDTKINNASEQIYNVLESEGFSNASIYNVENKNLRIEVSAPNGGQTSSQIIKMLQTIGVGKFEIRSSSSDDAIILDGANYVSGVSVKNYNGQIMTYIEFNDAGVVKFREVVSAASSIYIYMGGNMQTSVNVDGISTYNALPLTFEDIASAEDFNRKVMLGSLPIELDSNIVEINTMTSTIGNGTLIANPNASEFMLPLAKLLPLISLAVIILLGLVYMIVRFKVLGLLNLIAFLAEAIIMIFMLWAIPTIELSITGVLAIIAGVLLVNVSTLVYFGKVESERKLGKTVTAALENAYKKSLPVNLVSNVVIAILAGVFAIFTVATVQIASLIIFISAIIALIMSIGFIPFLVNIFESFNRGNEKLYGKVGGKTNG